MALSDARSQRLQLLEETADLMVSAVVGAESCRKADSIAAVSDVCISKAFSDLQPEIVADACRRIFDAAEQERLVRAGTPGDGSRRYVAA